MFKVVHSGARRGVVLSSLVRSGILWWAGASWGRWGKVQLGTVWRGLSFRGLALLGIVRSCPVRLRNVRLGSSFRSLVLHGTVLSCPARLNKALYGEVFQGVVSSGGAGSSPAGSSGVWFGKVLCFVVRSCTAGWRTVERCFVWCGEELFRQGGLEQSEVHYGTLLLWFGEVLLGVVGFIGALYSKVRSYCGMVRSVEVLHGIVKFCPQKHSVVGFAKALLRHGIVRRSTVRSGFARLRAVGQALFWWGQVWFGTVLPGNVWRCDVWSGTSRLGMVMWGPVRLGPAKYGFALRGMGLTFPSHVSENMTIWRCKR